MWGEKHNQEHYFDGQARKKHAIVAKHKEEEEFYVYMAKDKDYGSDKNDRYVDLGEFRHFINNIDQYHDFVGDKSQSDRFVLSDRQEYRITERK